MDIVEDKLKISIAYTLKERDGKIIEEVPANKPFVYIHGCNSIIPGLERALAGRHVDEYFTVDIPYSTGYGPYRNDLIIEVPKEELNEIGEIWLGMELEMCQDNDFREFQLPETADEFIDCLNLDDDEDDSERIYIIKEIKKETVILDGNHPFAGKDLTFDVKVVNIESASFTELESGLPDGFDEEEDFDDGYDDDSNRRWI